MDRDPFKEYIKESEPGKRDKGYAWHTAIGLQAVDGLTTSKYLIDTAIRNIEGDISIDEASELLNSYYEENPKTDSDDRNLLLDEKNELHNRSMRISGLLKADIEEGKADIEEGKADIDGAKADIEKCLANIDEVIRDKTSMHIIALYEECGKDTIFGRSIVEKITGLKSSRASEIINLMLENEIIVSVKGNGKGKYRFK